VICEYRAKEQLKLLGIRFPPGGIARTLDDAMRIAAKLGYPIALKAQSGELPHKSDVGGVVLNVQDANSIAADWDRLQENIARNRPGLELDGVLVESMSPSGMELIIGGRNDPQWGPVILAGFGGVVAAPIARRQPAQVPVSTIEAAARALRSGENTALLLGGGAMRERGVSTAARIAAATGAELLAETFVARAERGAGVPNVQRLAYLGEMAAGQLDGLRRLILIGARSPVSFFAYPGKPSDLVPEGCEVITLAGDGDDVIAALDALALAVDARNELAVTDAPRPDRPTGALGADTVALAIGALLPEGAIVSDEAATSGTFLPGFTAGAPRHDWLSLTGGAIGQGLPVAVGAAVACPDRPVLALEADGSALYTVQSLWTMAREQLDVTTVIFSNRRYAILRMELARVGATASGERALQMLDIAPPEIDFVSLAQGFGVPASRPETAEAFSDALERAFAEPGPHLIEAVVPSLF